MKAENKERKERRQERERWGDMIKCTTYTHENVTKKPILHTHIFSKKFLKERTIAHG